MTESSTDDLRDLYQDLILDHGKNPHNFRALPEANCEAVGHNPFCGDKLVLYIAVNDKGTVEDATFQGKGCAISTASASIMTEILKGKTAKEAKGLFEYFHAICTGRQSDMTPPKCLGEDDLTRLHALSGVRHYPSRVKCATLAWQTLMSALRPDGVKTASTED